MIVDKIYNLLREKLPEVKRDSSIRYPRYGSSDTNFDPRYLLALHFAKELQKKGYIKLPEENFNLLNSNIQHVKDYLKGIKEKDIRIKYTKGKDFINSLKLDTSEVITPKITYSYKKAINLPNVTRKIGHTLTSLFVNPENMPPLSNPLSDPELKKSLFSTFNSIVRDRQNGKLLKKGDKVDLPPILRDFLKTHRVVINYSNKNPNHTHFQIIERDRPIQEIKKKEVPQEQEQIKEQEIPKVTNIHGYEDIIV